MHLRSGVALKDLNKVQSIVDNKPTSSSARSRSPNKASVSAFGNSSISDSANKSQDEVVVDNSDERTLFKDCACNKQSAGSRPSLSVPDTAVFQSDGGDNTMANNVQNHVIGQHSRPPRDTVPHNSVVVWGMKLLSGLLVLLYFIIPAFVKLYPAIIVDVAFLNHFSWPPFINLNKPSEFGLNYTHNFFFNTDSDVTVGIWHVLPQELGISQSLTGDALPGEKYTSLLNNGAPVVLYLHGNTGTRAGWHRVQMYKVLSKAGFHVVTFDYRGYGDSLGYPSEDGLVHDSISVFNWIKQHSGNVPVYLWGHSLGSAVATKTAAKLCQQGQDLKGLILESPFNNFIEAASNHPLSLPFRVMPWFSWVFIESIKLNKITFASDKNIADVTVPVLILHATDDGVVPYPLGRKLYDAALRRTSGEQSEFVTFDGHHGYGHKHIHKSPDLIPAVRKFTSKHSEERVVEDAP